MSVDAISGTRSAEAIEQAIREQRRTLRESALGQQDALEELASVWGECRHPDWDGFGAKPVELATFLAARELIDSLPWGFPSPSIGAEPDGQITLEWRRSPRRVLSVSVDPKGYLHYAGLYGSNRRFGSLLFFFALPERLPTPPEELLQLVRDL